MLKNTKFSVVTAFVQALTLFLDNITFYMVFKSIEYLLGFILIIVGGIYLEIITVGHLQYLYEFLKQNSWSFVSFKKYFLTPENLPLVFSHIKYVVLTKKLALISFVVFALVSSLTVSIGFIKATLRFIDHKSSSLVVMYRYVYLLPQYLIAKILYGLVVLFPWILTVLGTVSFEKIVLGMLPILGSLMIIYSLFVYQKLRFTKYFVIDQEMNAVQAMQSSWHLTKGSLLHLFMYSSLLMVLYMHPISAFLAMFFLLIGNMSEMSIYRQMISSK